MATSGVTVICFLTFAACIAGTFGQDQTQNNCAFDKYCTKCTANTAGSCVECNLQAGYTINKRTGGCVVVCPKIRGCLCCNDEGTECYDCMNLWGKTQDSKQCIECSSFPYCSQCTSTTVCDKCNDTIALGPRRDGVSAECGPCASNCLRCPNNGMGLCDICKEGYQTPYNGICSCADNCADCKDNGWAGCDTCVSGYGLVVKGSNANTCQKCPDNCDDCNNVAAGQCAKCSASYQLDIDFTCINCATPNICNGNGNCRTTGSGFQCSCFPNFRGQRCETPK